MCSHKQERSFGRAGQHASAGDFCSAFHQDMDILYWLALTLTSDESKAEQCFVTGLEECIEGNSVFREWARSWSRRVVIKNAIRLVSPRPDMTVSPPLIRQQEKARMRVDVAQVPLAHLSPFDRFVYVMSVLEGYADRDCAILLECSSADVVEARVRALTQIRRAVEISPARVLDHGSESRAVSTVFGTDAA